MDTQLLQEIRDLLKAGNATTKLGFGPPPKPRYVYANRSNPPHLWYMWDNNDATPIKIDHDALTGKVVGIAIEDKEYRGKPDSKVNLTVKADRTYIIQSGLETEFTKGLLQALEMADLSGVTTIAVEAGETDTVLFCRVYNSEGRSYYKPEWKEARCDADTLRQLAGRIQAKLGQSASAPSTEAPKAKPPVKPVVKAAAPIEPAKEEIIEYSFSEDDEQPSLLPTRSQAEWSAIIKGLTIGQSEVLRSELSADDLGPIKGQLLDNFDNQLKRLHEVKASLVSRSKALSISAAEMSAKLGKPSADCTLAELSAVADSIAPAKEFSEIAF